MYYSSIINNGFTALQLGYLSSTLELVSDGPQFIVSRGITGIVGDPPVFSRLAQGVLLHFRGGARAPRDVVRVSLQADRECCGIN